MSNALLLDGLRLAALASDPTGAAIEEAELRERLLNPPPALVINAPERKLDARTTLMLASVDEGGGWLERKLLGLAKSELFKAHDLKLLRFEGEHTGLLLRVNEKLLAPDDALISGDVHRRAYAARAAAAGEPVVWASLGGGIFPRAGFSSSIPLGGPASLTVGFSADASLGYALLAPYPLSSEGVATALKNVSVDLPFSAKKAKVMAEGSELLLRGTGQVGAHAGVGVGHQLGNSFVVLGVSAYGGVGYSKSAELALRVKRLDRSKVYVSLALVDGSSKSLSLGLNAGVDLQLGAHVPELGGGIYKIGADFTAEQVERQVERWLKADLSAVHSISDVERRVASYVFDLADPEAAEAYDRFMHLDASKADEMVESARVAAAEGRGWLPSVRAAHLNEEIKTSATTIAAHLGPTALFSYLSSARDNHGTVRTADGVLRFARADLSRAYSGILSRHVIGEIRVDHQLIAVLWEGASRPAYHYHLRGTVLDDGLTTKEDVRRFLELARSLRALSAEHEALLGDEQRLRGMGKTDRVVDAYVTHEGLANFIRIAREEPERFVAAHAEAYERIDRPWDEWANFGAPRSWRITPWLNRSHPEYDYVMGLLYRGPENGRDADRRSSSDEYRHITGRDLVTDHDAWLEVKALLALAEDLVDLDGDPARQIALFAKHMGDRRFDFDRALSTLSALAGKDGVLTHELAIRDKDDPRRNVIFARDGALIDPSAEIADRLERPR